MLSGNDAIKVTINHISAENCASGPLYLHQNVDVPLDENNEPVAAFKGNVRNISIHAFEVESYTGWYMMEIGMPDYYVSSVKIRNVRVPKIAGRGLLRLLAKDAYDVFLQGGVPLDGGVPGYSGPPGAAAYDITWRGARYVGPAEFYTGYGGLNLNTGNAFARENVEERTFMVVSGNDLPQENGYPGGAVELSRPGTARRGAAMVCFQDGASSANTGLRFYTGISPAADNSLRHVWSIGSNTHLIPAQDALSNIGSASNRCNTLFAASGVITTSDERTKTDIDAIPVRVLEVWGKVGFNQFRFRKSVEEKGEQARNHTGLIAQRIYDVFTGHGIDPFKYGILCLDAWDAADAVYGMPGSHRKEPEYDSDGNCLDPQAVEARQALLSPAKAAGEHLGIRYEEALVLEAAYERWRVDALEKRIARIENA